MLKVRVIPTLLWKNVGLVKGIGFDSWRRIGTVMPAIKVYNTREVDELMLLDIMASEEGSLCDVESLAEYSQDCFVPLCCGGGVRNIEDISRLLEYGADKVSINSAAYKTPDLIREAAQRYGSQCVVASVDVRIVNGSYRCFSHRGQQDTGLEVLPWVKQLEDLGAGEILLTSIERDGSMQGYDLKMIEAVTEKIRIPVIASGGAGNYQHMIDAVKEAGASAVAAASIFHFTEQTPLQAKKAMAQAGIPVRWPLV